MEKKYYELIVSLIKNHKKFIGYDSILDDIVEDVYNHSKIVMESVTNEEVILSYLTKVVNTSIITVPKKLNISNRVRQRSVAIEPAAQQEIKQAENTDIEDLQPAIEKVTESFDKEVYELPVETEPQNDIAEESEENEETEKNEIKEEDNYKEKTFESEAVDKDLVDKMINGVADEPLLEQVVEEIELPEELEEISEQNFDQDSTLEEFMLEESEPAVAEEIEEEPQEEEKQEDLVPEENFIEEAVIESEEEEEPILQDDSTAEELFLEEETEELDIQENSSIDLLSEEKEEEIILQEDLLEEIVSETETEKNLVDYSLPSYDCFNFNPEKAEFDEQEINFQLAEIESKHPEKQISRICLLKYSKNLSVSEIASIVEMSEEDVLDVLNEIIDIVKD